MTGVSNGDAERSARTGAAALWMAVHVRRRGTGRHFRQLPACDMPRVTQPQPRHSRERARADLDGRGSRCRDADYERRLRLVSGDCDRRLPRGSELRMASASDRRVSAAGWGLGASSPALTFSPSGRGSKRAPGIGLGLGPRPRLPLGLGLGWPRARRRRRVGPGLGLGPRRRITPSRRPAADGATRFSRPRACPA